MTRLSAHLRIVLLFLLGAFAPATGLTGPGERAGAGVDADVERLINIRHSLDEAVQYMHSHPGLFPQAPVDKPRLTRRAQREALWQFWVNVLDRVYMLDTIGRRHDALHAASSGKSKREAFTLSYAAFLMQYRYMLDIITVLENAPSMHTTLNEPIPELGLDGGSYKTVKFRFLNALRAAEFLRLQALSGFYGKDTVPALSAAIGEDTRTLWAMGLGEGSRLTYENALRIVTDTGFTVWFPVQKTVSEWMGDVKVLRPDHSLISAEQIRTLSTTLEPGDILLERREWYLSNIGLPGYWPHAALYIGSAEQRRAYFDDADVERHYAADGGFESALEKRYPAAYALSLRVDANAHRPRVLEAISEGVSFTTLEHSVDADSVAVLRPRLDKLAKARAIERAFHFSGRPYDFNFDFLTDAELVCTELVYKAYEARDGIAGLDFPTREIMGRTVTTANDIARMYDTEFARPDRQLDLVAFYDGHEWQGSAQRADSARFRQSWQRPKFFIWLQDSALEPRPGRAEKSQ